MDIVVIAAMDENRVIGQGGELPWYYPKDLEHFRETTMGHPVIMGRVTYEGIVEQLGGPLPGRSNIVLTTSDIDREPETVYAARSIDDALETAAELADTEAQTAYVAGGASVYEQMLPRADRMIITEVHETYEGDAYFPDWDDSEWTEINREEHDALSFVTYDSTP